MENLLFCLNATVPIFLTMMLGCLFKKIGWIDELFTKRLNKFVFQVALPALQFCINFRCCNSKVLITVLISIII